MAELYKSGKLTQIVKWSKYARFVCKLYSVTAFIIERQSARCICVRWR
jgi:hypothetical protein